MKFKIGDMIRTKPWSGDKGFYGILIQPDWKTSIGTPFDWLVMFFDGTFDGYDERDLERIQCLNT